MIMQQNENFNLDMLNLIRLIIDKIKPLAIIFVLAVIISTVVSYIIPPKFESTIILFPSSGKSVSEALFSKTSSSSDFLKFGTDEEVEQFLQILKSDDIRNRIFEYFDLFEHYNISLNEKHPRTKLNKRYEKNVRIRSTEFNSIKISVLDEDPYMAKLIVEKIADLGDSLINSLQKQRAIQAFKLVEREYLDVQRNLKFLHDSIKKLREIGIFEYESQVEIYNEAYTNALLKGNSQGLKEIKEKLDLLAKHGGNYSYLRNEIVYENDRLGHLRSKYMEAKVNAEQNLPHKYIVSQAEIPERKSYPIKWLIVSISTFLSIFFAILVLVIQENLKKKK